VFVAIEGLAGAVGRVGRQSAGKGAFVAGQLRVDEIAIGALATGPRPYREATDGPSPRHRSAR